MRERDNWREQPLYCAARKSAGLDDHLVFRSALADLNRAVVDESSNGIDDLLLGSIDFAEPDRSEELHVFLNEGSGPFGHGAEELLTHLLAGPFECQAKSVVLRLLEHLLNPSLINEGNI